MIIFFMQHLDLYDKVLVIYLLNCTLIVVALVYGCRT